MKSISFRQSLFSLCNAATAAHRSIPAPTNLLEEEWTSRLSSHSIDNIPSSGLFSLHNAVPDLSLSSEIDVNHVLLLVAPQEPFRYLHYPCSIQFTFTAPDRLNLMQVRLLILLHSKAAGVVLISAGVVSIHAGVVSTFTGVVSTFTGVVLIHAGVVSTFAGVVLIFADCGLNLCWCGLDLC